MVVIRQSRRRWEDAYKSANSCEKDIDRRLATTMQKNSEPEAVLKAKHKTCSSLPCDLQNSALCEMEVKELIV